MRERLFAVICGGPRQVDVGELKPYQLSVTVQGPSAAMTTR